MSEFSPSLGCVASISCNSPSSNPSSMNFLRQVLDGVLCVVDYLLSLDICLDELMVLAYHHRHGPGDIAFKLLDRLIKMTASDCDLQLLTTRHERSDTLQRGTVPWIDIQTQGFSILYDLCVFGELTPLSLYVVCQLLMSPLRLLVQLFLPGPIGYLSVNTPSYRFTTERQIKTNGLKYKTRGIFWHHFLSSPRISISPQLRAPV